MPVKKDPISRLYSLVERKGKRDFKSDGKRESDGNYVSGFSQTTSTSTLKKRPFVIVAKEIRLKTFCLSSDSEKTTYVVEISKGGKVVCRTRRQGAGNTTSFTGPDERFVGTETKAPTNWKIVRGKMPPSLLRL